MPPSPFAPPIPAPSSQPGLPSPEPENAPVVITRSPETEAAYLHRALMFEAHALRHMYADLNEHERSTIDMDPREVVSVAISRKPEWSSSTWRQMKASLVFRYLAMNTSESLEAVRMLEAETQAGTVKKSTKTSAKRKKSVSDKDLASVISRLRLSRSRYAPFLESWLLLGTLTGLRPHEWCQASLIWLAPVELEETGELTITEKDAEHEDGLAVPRPYLRVLNSKNTNGRAHGRYRHLDLSALKPEVVSAIGEFALLMESVYRAGDYRTYYRSCQSLLAAVNRVIGKSGNREVVEARKRVQIYSARHRFSSEAKKVMPQEAVAALMGHATNRTASLHYGRRISGSGGMSVRPVNAEVSRVRIKQTAVNPFLRTTPAALPSPAVAPSIPAPSRTAPNAPAASNGDPSSQRTFNGTFSGTFSGT
jgi:hypothetical protein